MGRGAVRPAPRGVVREGRAEQRQAHVPERSDGLDGRRRRRSIPLGSGGRPNGGGVRPGCALAAPALVRDVRAVQVEEHASDRERGVAVISPHVVHPVEESDRIFGAVPAPQRRHPLPDVRLARRAQPGVEPRAELVEAHVLDAAIERLEGFAHRPLLVDRVHGVGEHAPGVLLEVGGELGPLLEGLDGELARGAAGLLRGGDASREVGDHAVAVPAPRPVLHGARSTLPGVWGVVVLWFGRRGSHVHFNENPCHGRNQLQNLTITPYIVASNRKLQVL